MVIDKNLFNAIKPLIPKHITVLPYFNNKVLLAFTSLNGGNVLEKFIDMFIEWCRDLSILDQNKNDY